MIPKIIHYIWFGSKTFPKPVKKCIYSWKLHLKDYHLNFLGENELDLYLDCDFAKEAFKEKKWAFLSDYLRLRVLYDYGGVYMDTDMLVVKDFSTLLVNDVFLGNETDNIVNGAIIGAKKNSEFIKILIQYYQNIKLDEVEPIPIIISRILKEYQGSDNIYVCPVDYFYPYPYDRSYDYKPNPLVYVSDSTYAVHLWYKSWKTDMYKFVKAKNYIGALRALIKLILQKPFSYKLWRRLPGTLRLSLIQILKK